MSLNPFKFSLSHGLGLQGTFHTGLEKSPRKEIDREIRVPSGTNLVSAEKLHLLLMFME